MSDAAHHHQPYKTEALSSTTDSAPTSTVTAETSSTSAPSQSTVQPTNAQQTASTASTDKATSTTAATPSTPHDTNTATSATTGAGAGGDRVEKTGPTSTENIETKEGSSDAAKDAAEGEGAAASGTSAQTEYPPQMHAGKAGLGPHYNDGSGFADQVKAKGEIIKGKLTHNPELVEQGHLRQSGALAEKVRSAELNDDSDSPFSRPDDGETDKKPEDPKSEDVRETGHEARTAAATSGTKST